MIRSQFSLDLSAELIVDNFAGGGGASTGIEMALGRCADIAVNHDPEAVAMHKANHPQTLHLPVSVWEVDPITVTHGRPVGLAWFSPDCKHFSKAKGGKPRDKKIRGLAWVALHWVNKVHPRVLILENVEEFQTWCPILPNGQPNPWRKGWTFQCFIGALRRRGYVVDWRELRACDHGAPTIRKRLFLIARNDGQPIVWPEPTHADPKVAKRLGLKPWRTAAECIDWSIPCPSIFDRKRALAEATCRRIAKGIMRYVVNAAEPFIVPLTHQGADRRYPVDKPLPTVTAAHRGEMALVAPVVTEHANASSPRSWRADEPLRTQCAEIKGGHFAVAAANLVECAHGEASATGKRWGAGAQDLEKPLNTVAGSNNAALVTSFLAKHYGGVVGQSMESPTGTVTAVDHHSVVSAQLVGCGGRAGQSRPRGVDEPVQTITAKGDTAISAATLVRQFGTSNGADIEKPAPTAMADGGGKTQLVRAFLIKYYGNETEAHTLTDPIGTVTSRDRFGLVTVKGLIYAIADIGLRMLSPRELFRAQGFPDSYIIGDDGRAGLTLTKSAQVRMCGNSVCPPIAAALVRANVPELSAWSKEERRKRSA